MKTVTLLLFLLVSISAPAFGLERFEIVTTEELKQMLDRRAAGAMDFVLVNTLDILIYEHHSIPGSVNIPWNQASKAAETLGGKKDRMIVTY